MACRVTYDNRKYYHINEDMITNTLVTGSRERIEYNISVLTYQCVHGEAPEYLSNLIDMDHNHYLRSTVKKQLPVSMSKKTP